MPTTAGGRLVVREWLGTLVDTRVVVPSHAFRRNNPQLPTTFFPWPPNAPSKALLCCTGACTH